MFCCKRSRHGVAGCILLSLSRFVRAFVRCMHKGADKRGDEGRKVREEKVSYNEAHSDDARQDHFGSKTAARIKMLMSGLKKKSEGNE